MKKRTIVFILLIVTLPLVAFQCQRWMRYGKDFKIIVDPSPILLTSDTLSFNITVDPGVHEVSKDDKILFRFYIQHDGTTEQISVIELISSSPVTKRIKHKIDPNHEIEQLESTFQMYNGDKLTVKSPILPIANIEDLR